jgi:hypothetical protein
LTVKMDVSHFQQCCWEKETLTGLIGLYGAVENDCSSASLAPQFAHWRMFSKRSPCCHPRPSC